MTANVISQELESTAMAAFRRGETVIVDFYKDDDWQGADAFNMKDAAPSKGRLANLLKCAREGWSFRVVVLAGRQRENLRTLGESRVRH